MTSISNPNVLKAQVSLLREIQHLQTAAQLLAIGRPERARASEAALDLAKLREALLLTETKQVLQRWADTQHLPNAPDLFDHGDQLLWLLKNRD
jgi:hypothetical protein